MINMGRAHAGSTYVKQGAWLLCGLALVTSYEAETFARLLPDSFVGRGVLTPSMPPVVILGIFFTLSFTRSRLVLAHVCKRHNLGALSSVFALLVLAWVSAQASTPNYPLTATPTVPTAAITPASLLLGCALTLWFGYGSCLPRVIHIATATVSWLAFDSCMRYTLAAVLPASQLLVVPLLARGIATSPVLATQTAIALWLLTYIGVVALIVIRMLKMRRSSKHTALNTETQGNRNADASSKTPVTRGNAPQLASLFSSAALSPREREALTLTIKFGSINKAAQAMNVTSGAASTYTHRALRKLGIESIAEITESVAEPIESRVARQPKTEPRPTHSAAIALMSTCPAVETERQPKALPQSTLSSLIALTTTIGVLAYAPPHPFESLFATALTTVCLVSGLTLAIPPHSLSHPHARLFKLSHVTVSSKCISSLVFFTVGSLLPLAHNAVRLDLALSSAVLVLLCLLALSDMPWDNGRLLYPIRLGTSALLGTGVATSSHHAFLAASFGLSASHALLHSLTWQLSTRALALVATIACILCITCGPHISTSLEVEATASERAKRYLIGQGLTDMEVSIVLASAQGLTRPVICAKLHVAKGTVNSCRHAAYKKLNIHSLAELRDLLSREASFTMTPRS